MNKKARSFSLGLRFLITLILILIFIIFSWLIIKKVIDVVK